MNGKRAVVAMSGGVDSSVAAGLLVREGYEVIGITLRLWTPSPWLNGEKVGGCCSPQDISEAQAVCRTLGIPHYTFNLEEKFKEKVVDNFVAEYLEGRTPNPCVRCNSFIKFDVLFKYSLALKADVLATGHYARIEPPSGEGHFYRLRQAADPAKDQSYFLYMLNQENLARLLFPVGGVSKPEVRRLAETMDLVTAAKEDSQDVCFLEGRSYRDFLSERVAADRLRPGPIRTTQGRVIGRHEGLAFYTIGQREKLGVAQGRRIYVVQKDAVDNALVVGSEEETRVRSCWLHSVGWCEEVPSSPVRARVKIRYRHPGAWATVIPLEGGEARVEFEEPVGAVARGQSAVFFEGEFVLGGGVIDAAE